MRNDTFYRFLKISKGASIARSVHLVCAYLNYILMSLHLGLHWNTMIAAMRKNRKEETSAGRWIPRLLTAGIAGYEPPTYSAVGTSDGIASYRTMERRIQAIQANGTDAMIEVFQGLPHGFGLGTGTVAEGWIDRAVTFWERNMEQ